MPPIKLTLASSSSAAYGAAQPQSLAEELSIADLPKPWKNSHYSPKSAVGPGKRNHKSLKQILALERERVERLQLQARADAEEDRARGGEGRVREVVSYASVEAPPSVIPAKKWCDVTGLEAPYTDPHSTLRYHNAEVYEVIKTFQPGVVQAYLGVRGMAAKLT